MIEATRAQPRSDYPAHLHTLTTRQRILVEAIDQYERGTGEPCPANWLARRFSLHHTSVRESLERLHRSGWLLTPNAPVRLRRQR